MKRTIPCLPLSPTASRIFAFCKVFLILLFTFAMVSETLYTAMVMKQFKNRVAVSRSRSEIQIHKTHIHFFLFTGIWMFTAQTCGIWGLLSEYVPVILAYCFLSIIGLGFNLIGALQSSNEEVLNKQLFGSAPFPFLILFALAFARAAKKNELHLASLPIYRRTIVESRKSSITEIVYQPEPGPRRQPFVPVENNMEPDVPSGKISMTLQIPT